MDKHEILRPMARQWVKRRFKSNAAILETMKSCHVRTHPHTDVNTRAMQQAWGGVMVGCDKYCWNCNWTILKYALRNVDVTFLLLEKTRSMQTWAENE